MASPPLQPERAAELLARLEASVHQVIVGKRRSVRLAAAALVGGGHVLLQDLPGTGKTMLARALATTIGGEFRRIQCTPDLLPADITGASVFNQRDATFEFLPGPIFANVVLADEVNRATPRTQSALLEAMAEAQVTVEGVTHRLEQPFFVIATQNPAEFQGTYPLPESQLDRFLMCITLGYPDRASERALLAGQDRREAIHGLAPTMTPDDLVQAQKAVLAIHASDALLDYLQALIGATRSGAWFVEGLSPRAGIAVLRAAKARALLGQRDYVAPDDIQSVLVQAAAHRLVPVAGAGRGRVEQVRAMVEAVALP